MNIEHSGQKNVLVVDVKPGVIFEYNGIIYIKGDAGVFGELLDYFEVAENRDAGNVATRLDDGGIVILGDDIEVKPIPEYVLLVP